MENLLFSVTIFNVRWMGWNFLLALLPFLLSLLLFRPKTKTTPLWYLLTFVFFMFLPNAPYIFTDIIHLYSASFKIPSNIHLYFVAVQYIVFLLAGGILFVLSYKNFEGFIVNKYKLNTFFFRLGSFILISIGIYLGRFGRLNSWDIVFDPLLVLQSLASLFTLHSGIYISGFTILLFGVYYLYVQLRQYGKKNSKK